MNKTDRPVKCIWNSCRPAEAEVFALEDRKAATAVNYRSTNMATSRRAPAISTVSQGRFVTLLYYHPPKSAETLLSPVVQDDKMKWGKKEIFYFR